MKVGIIQGRLSKPDNGFQECPVDWKKEFDLLETLNLNHIEWIVTKYLFKTNPIFSEDVTNFPIRRNSFNQRPLQGDIRHR
jgi:hypothetical protein